MQLARVGLSPEEFGFVRPEKRLPLTLYVGNPHKQVASKNVSRFLWEWLHHERIFLSWLHRYSVTLVWGRDSVWSLHYRLIVRSAPLPSTTHSTPPRPLWGQDGGPFAFLCSLMSGTTGLYWMFTKTIADKGTSF